MFRRVAVIVMTAAIALLVLFPAAACTAPVPASSGATDSEAAIQETLRTESGLAGKWYHAHYEGLDKKVQCFELKESGAVTGDLPINVPGRASSELQWYVAYESKDNPKPTNIIAIGVPGGKEAYFRYSVNKDGVRCLDECEVKNGEWAHAATGEFCYDDESYVRKS